MLSEDQVLRPGWDAPAVALATTRAGGVSRGDFESLNVSFSVGDDADAVRENRRRAQAAVGAPIVWLNLVHGAEVVRLRATDRGAPAPVADAAWTDEPGVACAVTAADCVPVLFSTADGRAVAAAHAGWRGLSAGVLEATVSALAAGAGREPATLRAWIGPAIGARAYEVGADVLAAFGVTEQAPGEFFRQRCDASDGSEAARRWHADLIGMARQRLREAGVREISGGGWCTASDPSRFFSFRRDGRTGRMLAAIRPAPR